MGASCLKVPWQLFKIDIPAAESLMTWLEKFRVLLKQDPCTWMQKEQREESRYDVHYNCLNCEQGNSDLQQSSLAICTTLKALLKACQSSPSATVPQGDSCSKVPRVLNQLVLGLPAQICLILPFQSSAAQPDLCEATDLARTSAHPLQRVSKHSALWSIYEEWLPI